MTARVVFLSFLWTVSLSIAKLVLVNYNGSWLRGSTKEDFTIGFGVYICCLYGKPLRNITSTYCSAVHTR